MNEPNQYLPTQIHIERAIPQTPIQPKVGMHRIGNTNPKNSGPGAEEAEKRCERKSRLNDQPAETTGLDRAGYGDQNKVRYWLNLTTGHTWLLIYYTNPNG